MKRFLIIVGLALLVGVALALLRQPNGLSNATGAIMLSLGVGLGWYAERTRNARVVWKVTKEALPGYRRGTFRAGLRTAMIGVVILLIVYAGTARKDG